MTVNIHALMLHPCIRAPMHMCRYGPSTAVVMGADLNSIPGSGVYTLTTEGHLPSTHPHLSIPGKTEPWAEQITMPRFEYEAGLEAAAGESTGAAAAAAGGTRGAGAKAGPLYGGGGAALCQPMPLTSAYGSILGGEPLFTNFTPGFIGTLDYIFGNAFVHPRRVLMLPSEDDVRKDGFIPAGRHPSDHLYLLARFAFHRTLSGKRERADEATAQAMLVEE